MITQSIWVSWRMILTHCLTGKCVHSLRRVISLGLFFNQGIDEIDSIVEACLFALIDKCRTQGDSNVGFAGPGAADKN